MASVSVGYRKRYLHTHEVWLWAAIAVADELSRLGRLDSAQVAVVERWKEEWRTSGVGTLSLALDELGASDGGRTAILGVLGAVRQRIAEYGSTIPAAVGNAANQLPGDVTFVALDGGQVAEVVRSVEALVGTQ